MIKKAILLSPSYTFKILATIHHDSFNVTYIIKSGCIGKDDTENSEITIMSHDVPTVSLV